MTREPWMTTRRPMRFIAPGRPHEYHQVELTWSDDEFKPGFRCPRIWQLFRPPPFVGFGVDFHAAGEATIETYELRESYIQAGDPGYGNPLDRRANPRPRLVERWYELVTEAKK